MSTRQGITTGRGRVKQMGIGYLRTRDMGMGIITWPAGGSCLPK